MQKSSQGSKLGNIVMQVFAILPTNSPGCKECHLRELLGVSRRHNFPLRCVGTVGGNSFVCASAYSLFFVAIQRQLQSFRKELENMFDLTRGEDVLMSEEQPNQNITIFRVAAKALPMRKPLSANIGTHERNISTKCLSRTMQSPFLGRGRPVLICSREGKSMGNRRYHVAIQTLQMLIAKFSFSVCYLMIYYWLMRARSKLVGSCWQE